LHSFLIEIYQLVHALILSNIKHVVTISNFDPRGGYRPCESCDFTRSNCL